MRSGSKRRSIGMDRLGFEVLVLTELLRENIVTPACFLAGVHFDTSRTLSPRLCRFRSGRAIERFNPSSCGIHKQTIVRAVGDESDTPFE